MRLDFRNIGKGLEAIAGAKQARDLAQESARFDVTEGAYGPGLQENIQQLQGLRAQDPAQANAYDQAIGELTRRSAMTAPDFSVASGPTNFASRQEARQAAAPMRAEGLAGVYRRYGDVEQADALETRAFEQQRGLAREARDAEAFRTQQAAAEQQATIASQRIDEGARSAAAAKRTDDFNAWRSQNPQADFAAMSSKAQELGMGVDEQFKLASNLTGIGEQEFKMSQQRIQKLVQNQGLDGLLKAHKESKDLDPDSHFEVIRGKGGTLSLNRVDTNTGQIIQPNVFSGNEAETTAYLNRAAMDPATIIDYTMNLEKNKAAIAAQGAATEASRAATGLRNQQQQMLSTQAAGSAEAQQIRAEFDALTPDEQVGAKGRALMNRFNMANQKAGATVPLGTAARADSKDLSPQQQRAFDTLKNTDAFKNAVERGNQALVRKLLTDNAIPPEAFYGSTAAPPGGGDWTAAPAPAAERPAARPEPAASRAEQPPSPAQMRYLRERSVGALTPRGQLEAAANAGNPAAIRELERRVVDEETAAQRNFENTQRQMRGLQ
jgi:hypothetical protein